MARRGTKKSGEPKIVFAKANLIEENQSYVAILLASLAKHWNVPGIAYAWVSDRSSVSDFTQDVKREKEVLAEVSKDVKTRVKPDDLIYAVAQRMAKRK